MAEANSTAQDYVSKILYAIGALLTGFLGARKFGAARASGMAEEINTLRQRVAQMEQKLIAATKKVEDLQASVDSSESRQRRIEMKLADIQREMRDGLQEVSETIERFVQQMKQRHAPEGR